MERGNPTRFMRRWSMRSKVLSLNHGKSHCSFGRDPAQLAGGKGCCYHAAGTACGQARRIGRYFGSRLPGRGASVRRHLAIGVVRRATELPGRAGTSRPLSGAIVIFRRTAKLRGSQAAFSFLRPWPLLNRPVSCFSKLAHRSTRSRPRRPPLRIATVTADDDGAQLGHPR
jgi:hypothetical protein